MASVTLSDLLSVGCDIELKFEDGTMPANSGALRLMSSVFNNALDAQHCQAPIKETKASACSAPTTASKTNIPLPGITLEQWLRIAEFLYPVVPSPKIKDSVWAEAEYLLEVGTKFDLQLLMHKVDLYLERGAPEMFFSPGPERDPRRWLKLADSAGLTVCLPAIAKRISTDRNECTHDDNLEGLSTAAFKALLKALAGATCY